MSLFKPNIEKLERKKDIPKLVKAMAYKKSPYLQRDAAEALAELGEPGFSSLVMALASDNRDVVYYAVHGLGKTADGRAVKPLVELMSGRPEWELRSIVPDNIGYKAAQVIGEIGDESTILLLADVISTGKNVDMAVHSLEILGAMAVPTLITFSKIDRDERAATRSKAFIHNLRYRAMEALGRVGDARAIPHLVELMNDENSEIRDGAEEALETIGGAAVPALEEALGSDDHNTRAGAVRVLALIRGKEGASLITGMLNDNDLFVVNEVAETLRWVGGMDSIKPLEAILEKIEKLKGADKASVLWENEPVSGEDEPSFKGRKRTKIVRKQIGQTIKILRGEKVGGFWDTFEKIMYTEDYRKTCNKVDGWTRRLRMADLVDVMDIQEEMAGYFGGLYKKNPELYDHFEEGHSELDSLILYRETGEYDYVD